MATTAELMAELRAIGAELLDLGRIGRLLSWDQETMMPRAGTGYRSRQRATLQGIAHERLTRPRVGELLDALEEPARRGELAPEDAAIVRVIRRDFDRAVKLPTSFVKEMAQVTAEGVEVWRRAREESRFTMFAPVLERIVALKRQESDYVGYAEHPYDAHLDKYEPGMTVSTLTPLFAELRRSTGDLLARLQQAHRQPDPSILDRDCDEDKQWALATDLARAIGFDFDAGRIDRSTHPFSTSMGPGDARITDRVNPRNLGVALFGALHEAGHGIYEQGIDPDLAESPIGVGASLGIHESQSRLWENFVGRGRSFWQFAYPRLQAVFPDQFASVPLDDFVFAINRVAPSLIRVEADEVTYNLHIILRYEIERQLATGEVQVGDLPEIWNAMMQDYLGVTPPNDRLGVLQDIHWAIGHFGYFPTYSLGNLYGAQLWSAIRHDLPDLDGQISAGEFAPLRDWLRERIHRIGRLYEPLEILSRATGSPASPEHLGRYLNDKFVGLYFS